ISVQLDNTGNHILTQSDVNAISAGTSDSCGTASTNLSPNAFTFCNLGANLVTNTVVDVNGNTNQTTGTITVLAPLGLPGVVYVDPHYTGGCALPFPFTNGTEICFLGYNAFSTIQAGL